MSRAAAIYTRISKDDRGDQLGVMRQEKDCRAPAERKGWPVVQVFRDDDVSAFVPGSVLSTRSCSKQSEGTRWTRRWL